MKISDVTFAIVRACVSRAKNSCGKRNVGGKISIAVFALCSFLSSGSLGAVDIAQQPLYAGSRVPGNLTLVPSVEFPTLISVANFGDYNEAVTYAGYFDAAKCYEYRYNISEAQRHFYPTGLANNRRCVGDGLWSGNFMNWAATQTIDPFRAALTGGYRVRDEVGVTWLEKAISDRSGNDDANANFPRRTTSGSSLVGGATPAGTSVENGWGSIRTRVDGLGNKMWFSTSQSNLANGAGRVDYDPSVHKLTTSRFCILVVCFGDTRNVVFEVSVRVAACVPPLTPNELTYCKQYGANYKPEGLIQEYSDRLRFSIFGYLNNGGDPEPDGGVMRARQKFVGPQTWYPEFGPQSNIAAEWNAANGILFQNPDSTDASATNSQFSLNGTNAIRDSGVINYLNKFGQMSTGRNAKSFDNVSELFYAASRYYRSLGNVPEYSNLSAIGGSQPQSRYRLADAFPVITEWDDPIRYRCQTNVILGIGDTNTWRDKNLPGQTPTASEPSKPALVAADATVDVVADMHRIWRMEGKSESDARSRSVTTGFNNSNHSNSGYIAALAYAAHTRDIRPDLPGRQSFSTYWVDVVENRNYKDKDRNQYWLATKYGGFQVSAGFDPNGYTAPDPSTWRTTNDVINNDSNFPRPDNFYVAADAARMVLSLREAFKNIVDAVVGSGGGFASSSTLLETGTQTFQGRFRVANGSWSGDLQAYDVNVGNGSLTATWTASSALPAWGSRKIMIPGESSGLVRLGATAYASLPAYARTGFGSAEVVDYIRGNRALERPNGALRARSGVLGDIVNSEPVYVGAPNRTLFLGATFNGASTYQAYVAANQNRTRMVYVGANDGMLHGFNAQTGAEVFAFMPRQVVSSMAAYAQPNYEHRYLVDGELTVADVYDSDAQIWRTVLVGTMGRGGRGMFALDVTNPADPKLLWELSSSNSGAFGNNLGKPIIAQVANGDWRVLLGNGPNSSSGLAQLIAVRAVNGQDFLATSLGADASNGLSGVNVWSSTRGGFSDRVYAGDLRGNLWRISYAAGSFSSATRLFTAERTTNVRQPITATPLVARRPNTDETWIFFGTGQYLNAADLANKQVQSWYGLKDPGGTTAITRASLRQISILAEDVIDGTPVRGIERYSTLDSQAGWYMDLQSPGATPEGERMVVPNRFRGFALIGTTRIPDSGDICSPTGKGFVMAIDPFGGGRLSGGSFFDVDGDGRFTETVGDTGIPVSGIGTPSGPNNPIFIGDVMQLNLDDASTQSVGTNALGTQPRRVSWRELLRN